MADEDYVTVKTKKFSNGDIYTGTWTPAGLPDGDGKYTWKDGSVYEGSWKEGVKHGIGKYTWPSGATYHGEWLDGSMHGVGTWESADGRSRYQGGWHKDTKHGLGRQVYASGDVYEGLWKLGAPGGPGRYVYADGNEYDGEWRAGRMHGHGTFVWRSGERYDGEWKDGRMDGAGLFTYSDGSTYDGCWRRGRKHGVGVFRQGPGQGHGSGSAAAVMDGLGSLGGVSSVIAISSPDGVIPTFARNSGNAPPPPPPLGRAVVGYGAGPLQNGDGSSEGSGAVTIGSTSEALAGAASVAFPPMPPLSPVPAMPIMFPSLPPSAPDSPRSPRPGQGQGWPLGAPGSSKTLNTGGSVTVYPTVAPASTSALAAISGLVATSRGALQQGSAPGAAASPSNSAQLASQPLSSDAQGPAFSANAAAPGGSTMPGGPAEVAADLPVPAPAHAPAGAAQLLGIQQQQAGSLIHSGGSVSGGGAGGKLVFIRAYDKGRPLRETALSLDDLELLMPGMMAQMRRGGSADRGPNHLLRLLRGAGGAHSRPRAWPRMGDTVTQAHHAYALMVALQLGIRYSVGRISHEPLPRSVSQDEYSLRVQQEFPRGGSEMTPVHPVEDFTWSDYAPVTFRRLRESFGVDASTYMLSLCSDHSLRHLASPGKSGSVFFLSQDERFFIKTMARCEMEVLLSMLPAYHRHVERHPHTLLCRFFGLHCITTPSGRKYRFVVMSNIFRTPLQLHRKYDLKGSTLGRTAGKQPTDDPTIIFKDLDLDLKLRLEDGWRDRLLFQLRADTGLLSGVGVMDYSLLVGLHFRGRAVAPPPDADTSVNTGGTASEPSFHPYSATNHREHNNTQQLAHEYPRVEERIQRLKLRLGLSDGATGDLIELAKMRMLGHRGHGREPTPVGQRHDQSSRQGSQASGKCSKPVSAGTAAGDVCVSVNDELALRMGQSRVQLGVNMAATAIHKDGQEEDVVLWFALIDILQPYNATKRLEHSLKSVIHSANSISVTHPNAYANRFQLFMKTVFE